MRREVRQDDGMPNGNVDEENPAPGVIVGDPAAERGADDRRHHHAHAEMAMAMPRLAGGKLSSRIACAMGCNAAAARALQDAEEHQRSRRLGASPHSTELSVNRATQVM